MLDDAGRQQINDGARLFFGGRPVDFSLFFLNDNSRLGMLSHNQINAFILPLPHLSDKTVAAFRHGFDVLAALLALTERFAERRDVLVELDPETDPEALLPEDLTDAALRPFVSSVLDFQRSSLQSYASDEDYLKYLQAAGSADLKPLVLILVYQVHPKCEQEFAA